MCEFKVYLVGENPEEKEQVAKDIVVAKIRDNRIVLLNVMGEPVYVESTSIREVNTMTQELILQKPSISG
jgi:predicted RNA-binding protein